MDPAKCIAIIDFSPAKANQTTVLLHTGNADPINPMSTIPLRTLSTCVEPYCVNEVLFSVSYFYFLEKFKKKKNFARKFISVQTAI